MPNGILVDYEWCSGCHSCEMACKLELNLPEGQWGVNLAQIGPYQIDEETWEWVNMPVFTKQCNLCEDRVVQGKLPTCVQHCQAAVLKYGELEDLAKELIAKPKQVLFHIEKQTLAF